MFDNEPEEELDDDALGEDGDDDVDVDEDDDVELDVVPVLLPVDVEELVDEVSEGSSTSKLNHIQSIVSFILFPFNDDLHEHINYSV